MTDGELADRICSGKPVSVSMSKYGIFLTVGGVSAEIDSRQACIVWAALPEIMRALPRTTTPKAGDAK